MLKQRASYSFEFHGPRIRNTNSEGGPDSCRHIEITRNDEHTLMTGPQTPQPISQKHNTWQDDQKRIQRNRISSNDEK